MKEKNENSRLAERLAEKAMFHNPVASVSDRTGYVPVMPKEEKEALSFCENVNATVTSLDGGKALDKAR